MPTVIIPEDACLEDYFKVLDRYEQTCVAQWRKVEGKFSVCYYIKVGLATLQVTTPPKVHSPGFYVATKVKGTQL